MLCGGSMVFEAEFPMNISLKYLYTKGQLKYDAECIKEMPNCACQGNFIEKL